MDHLKIKDYLGDGVYVGFDGYQIWLYTQEDNRIALEPVVMDALIHYRDNLSIRVAALQPKE